MSAVFKLYHYYCCWYFCGDGIESRSNGSYILPWDACEVKSFMFYLFTLFTPPPRDFLFSSLMSGYLCQPQGRESYDLENKDGSLKFHWLGQICWFSALTKHAFKIAVMFLVTCCSPSLALGFLKIKFTQRKGSYCLPMFWSIDSWLQSAVSCNTIQFFSVSLLPLEASVLLH